MINSKKLIDKLEKRELNDKFAEIYFNDKEQFEYQSKRYITAIRKYQQIFGEGEIDIYSAPGRTEVGGNHTDHQNGRVLAASINLDAIAIVGRCEEPKIQILSEGYDLIEIDLNDLSLKEDEKETTTALIKGVLAGMKKRGYHIGPLKAYITSDVLIGAGLSSSAAFEALIGTIISGMYNEMKVSPVEIAEIGQYAENVYFGKPCGLMDQMACSIGGFVYIDFKNPEKPKVEKVAFHIEEQGYQLCIVDTKGSHADLTVDYAAIPMEMKKVADYLGQDVLSQIDEETFYEKIPEIRKTLGDRAALRAFHFFNENKRVLGEVNALKSKNMEEFLKIFQSSADSSYKYLQNVYSNQDWNRQAVPVALAFSENILGEKGVCRVHGGGFAGTIQVFVRSCFVSEYQKKIEKILGKHTCHVLKIRKYGGVKVI